MDLVPVYLHSFFEIQYFPIDAHFEKALLADLFK